MNVPRAGIRATLAALALALPAHAQPDAESGARGTLQWTADLMLPAKTTARYLAFDVLPEVYGKSKNRLADLRIFDQGGQEVPFAIRELRTKIERQNVPIQREFDPGDGNERALELQDGGAAGFNEIEIDTTGKEFRRTVDIYGARTFDFKKEQPIRPEHGKEHVLVHESDKGGIDIRRLHFPLQRYPFVRVVVNQDAGNFEDRPKITKIAVRRATSAQGKYLARPATLTPAGGTRGDGGGPATAWFIDLGDEVPCEGLSFRVNGQEVDRPFRLEFAAPDENKTNGRSLARPAVTGVDWRWRREGDKLYLDAIFPEVVQKKFRLVVTNFDNPELPLDPGGVTYKSCVRQVIFERPEKGFAEPLKLYIGNEKVQLPRYDVETRLPTPVTPPPAETQVGGMVQNPDWRPPPQPFHENTPWLVYVILSAACMILLGILAVLGKRWHGPTR